MKNIDYIKSLNAKELGRFLTKIRLCGSVGNCIKECPWRAYWKMEDLKSMEYSKIKSFSRFECPALTEEWLKEEVKPELHYYEA